MSSLCHLRRNGAKIVCFVTTALQADTGQKATYAGSDLERPSMWTARRENSPG